MIYYIYIMYILCIIFICFEPKVESLGAFASIRLLQFQCSYEFHFEGFSNFSASVEGSVQIRDVNPRISKWNMKHILNLCRNDMVHVSNTMWRIHNQPSSSTSCSDDALRLLVLVAGRSYWGLQVLSSFCDLGLRIEDSFWERYILKGQIVFWRALKTLFLNIGCFTSSRRWMGFWMVTFFRLGHWLSQLLHGIIWSYVVQ